jgi:hypothetical protein
MIFPSAADFRFWQAKQAAPSWASRFTEKVVPDVDGCVNAHTGAKVTSGELAAQNLLALLRGHRRRGGDVVQYLTQLSRVPGTSMNPEKRAAFAKKWAARMQKSQKENEVAMNVHLAISEDGKRCRAIVIVAVTSEMVTYAEGIDPQLTNEVTRGAWSTAIEKRAIIDTGVAWPIAVT